MKSCEILSLLLALSIPGFVKVSVSINIGSVYVAFMADFFFGETFDLVDFLDDLELAAIDLFDLVDLQQSSCFYFAKTFESTDLHSSCSFRLAEMTLMSLL